MYIYVLESQNNNNNNYIIINPCCDFRDVQEFIRTNFNNDVKINNFDNYSIKKCNYCISDYHNYIIKHIIQYLNIFSINTYYYTNFINEYIKLNINLLDINQLDLNLDNDIIPRIYYIIESKILNYDLLRNILDFVFDTKYLRYDTDYYESNHFYNSCLDKYFIIEDKLKCYNPIDNFDDYITYNIHFKSEFLNNENENYLNKIMELKNKNKMLKDKIKMKIKELEDENKILEDILLEL